jgi:hypothetical protein
MRIIGIELRCRTESGRSGNQQREIGIIPCDIELIIPQDDPNEQVHVSLNGTIHTDMGDLGFQINADGWQLAYMTEQSHKIHSPVIHANHAVLPRKTNDKNP